MPTEIKTALLHYWLTNMRGGENVFLECCRTFPQADIFTHACLKDKIDPHFSGHRITESFISRLPGGRKHCQKYLPLMPLALKKLDLQKYDFVLSSESGPVKGICKRSDAIHICYCHSPMRYCYDLFDDYYQATNAAGKLAMRIFTPVMKKYDLSSADSVDFFIANSAFVAERIQRIYHRDSTVIHPPVDVNFFSQAVHSNESDYYLLVGEMTAYKHPELALKACLRMNKKLIAVGDGPMKKQLQKTANGSPLITFAGRPDKEQLRTLYAKARALIFPGIEDFGIIPVEAQCTGCPVIARQAGGALETVIPQVTGVFFRDSSVDSLCHAIEEFESLQFKSDTIKNHASNFNTERFRTELKNFIIQRTHPAIHDFIFS